MMKGHGGLKPSFLTNVASLNLAHRPSNRLDLERSHTPNVLTTHRVTRVKRPTKLSVRCKITNKLKRSYSIRPKKVELISLMLQAPAMATLVRIVQIDLKLWQIFVKSEKNAQKQELLLKNCDQVGVHSQPLKTLLKFANQSTLFLLLKIVKKRTLNHLTDVKTGSRLVETNTCALFFTLIKKLPLFLKNTATQLVMEFRLSNMIFLNRLPMSLCNKNSTGTQYESGVKQIANLYELSPSQLRNKLFNKPFQISDLSLTETLYLQCHRNRWLGASACGIINALKNFATQNGSTRFKTTHWKDVGKNLKKIYGTKRKNQVLKRNITAALGKTLWFHLRLAKCFRLAEFVRFLCLTGQRNVDYFYLLAADIYVCMRLKAVRITWHWGKTRSRTQPTQFTWLPFGNENTFFDILGCVRVLQKLKPQEDEFLLRWADASQATKLRAAFTILPLHLQINAMTKVTPYWFKSVLADVLLQAQLAPNIVCHYLKHTLTQKELQIMAHKMQFTLGQTSAKYAISTDQLPNIRIKLQLFWDNIEMLH